MTTFISYSSKDTEKVKQIVQALEANGIKCFYAPRDIEPGKEYAAEIIKAIKNMDCVTLVFSNASNSSMYVLREVNSAVLNNKSVIPFRVDNAEPSESMEFYIGTTHFLDATKLFDTAIGSLVQAIAKTSGQAALAQISLFFEKPTMLDAAEAEKYGYDIQRIALETIQLDYLALAGNQYLLNDKVEGTVQDWLELFTNYPDMYSLLFYHDQLIGYWLTEIISSDNYDRIASGEQIISPDMQEFYDFGGDFDCYVAIMPLIKQYENAANYLALFSSLFARLVSLAQKDVCIDRIGISVYSALQEQLVKRLGFAYKTNNVANGKIYEINREGILKSDVIRKNYPDFYALYQKCEG